MYTHEPCRPVPPPLRNAKAPCRPHTHMYVCMHVCVCPAMFKQLQQLEIWRRSPSPVTHRVVHDLRSPSLVSSVHMHTHAHTQTEGAWRHRCATGSSSTPVTSCCFIMCAHSMALVSQLTYSFLIKTLASKLTSYRFLLIRWLAN